MGKGKKNKKNKASATEEKKEEARIPAHLLVMVVHWEKATDAYSHLLAFGPCEEPLLPLRAHAFDGPFEVSKPFDARFTPLWEQCTSSIDEKKKKDADATSFCSTTFLVHGQDIKSPWNPAVTRTITVFATLPANLEVNDVLKPKWSELIHTLFQIQAPMIYVDGETSMVILEAGKARAFVFGVFGKRGINGYLTTPMKFHLMPPLEDQ